MDGLGSAEIFQFEGFRFDRTGGCLSRMGGPGGAEPVTLGSRALALLALLIDRQGQLVPKDEIFAAVWPGTAVEEANLTVQISALRRVLDWNRKQGSCIQTIPGRGYRFVPPVTRAEALIAASISTPGNGSSGPVAAAAQPQPPSAMCPIDALPPGARPSAPQRLRRAVIAIVAGTLWFAAVLVAVANWRSLSPWQDRSAPRMSIVVLPFTNLSNDHEQQYFADALTEDLTTDLSRIAHTFVIPSGTAFKFKGKPVDTKQIGRELGVRYVLEGSVQRSADRVRVGIQLIDSSTDAYLWVDRFDRDRADLFALLDEITSRIALHLDRQLAVADARYPTDQPDAVDYILRGRAAFGKWPILDNYAEAIGLFERALALSPRSAEARSSLADVLSLRVLRQQTETRAADIARAEELVEQALSLSPRSGYAHHVKGQVLRIQNRCREAIPEYEAVIDLYPKSASAYDATDAYGNLGWCKFLTGSIDEVIPLEEKAIHFDPGDPFMSTLYFRIGRVHLLQSRIPEAISAFERVHASNSAVMVDVHAYLAAGYALKGDAERAVAELTKARRLSHDDRYSNISRLNPPGYSVPALRELYESTLFAGLRKAGMPEE